MAVIVMPVVTTLKAPISVSANQDFMETEETAAWVINYYLLVTFRCLFEKKTKQKQTNNSNKMLTDINWGSRDSAVDKSAIPPSHYCDSGSIPAHIWVAFVAVSRLAPRVFLWVLSCYSIHKNQPAYKTSFLNVTIISISNVV